MQHKQSPTLYLHTKVHKYWSRKTLGKVIGFLFPGCNINNIKLSIAYRLSEEMPTNVIMTGPACKALCGCKIQSSLIIFKDGDGERTGMIPERVWDIEIRNHFQKQVPDGQECSHGKAEGIVLTLSSAQSNCTA